MHELPWTRSVPLRLWPLTKCCLMTVCLTRWTASSKRFVYKLYTTWDVLLFLWRYILSHCPHFETNSMHVVNIYFLTFNLLLNVHICFPVNEHFLNVSFILNVIYKKYWTFHYLLQIKVCLKQVHTSDSNKGLYSSLFLKLLSYKLFV